MIQSGMDIPPEKPHGARASFPSPFEILSEGFGAGVR